jgi:hypothetical protein
MSYFVGFFLVSAVIAAFWLVVGQIALGLAGIVLVLIVVGVAVATLFDRGTPEESGRLSGRRRD